MNTDKKKQIPYDIEVEQAVLGCLLVSNKLVDEVAADLEAKDFYDPLHQALYEMIVGLVSEGPVTPLILHSVMSAHPGMQDVGGHAYLAGLAEAAPALSSRDIHRLAKALLDLSERRELIRIGEELVDCAYETSREVPTEKIAAETADALVKIGTVGRRDTVSVVDVMDECLKEAELALAGNKPPSIKLGFGAFDKATGGLMATEHLVTAGRSGAGKTAVAVSGATWAAMHGTPVLVFALDGSAKSWAQRSLCDVECRLHPEERPIWRSKFRHGTLSNLEITRLAEARRVLHGLPYDICNAPILTAPQILSRGRAFAAKHKGQMCLFVIDFVQKIADEKWEHNDSKETRVNNHVYQMANLANLTGGVAWSLAQMLNKNRGGNKNQTGSADDELPIAEDIRESGAIEMSADIGFFPYRRAFSLSRKEPEKHDFGGSVRPEWSEWHNELEKVEHIMRFIGFKIRDGSPNVLNGEYWCDMGSNAIRDERPLPIPEHDKAAEQLAMGLG